MKEERKEGGGGGFAFGHTFGVRVDGPLARGLWPPDGGRLCRRVVKRKVLKMDRPLAGGFLSLTAFQAEGCGGGFAASLLKSALRDWLSMSYGMKGILVMSSQRRPPKRGDFGVVYEVYAVQSLKSDSLKSMTSFGNTIPRSAGSGKPTADSHTDSGAPSS